MNAVEMALNELKEMVALPLSPSVKNRVHELYELILNKTFKPTSCKNCYHDAIIEMYTYLKRNMQFKTPQEYVLVFGACIQQDFGSSKFITRHNCTDEIAEMLLLNGQAKPSDFEKIPSDWEQRIEILRNGANPAFDIVADMRKMIAEGKTDAEIKASFKGYELNGKKLTKKSIIAYLIEAKNEA